jgi:PHD/YefM family antitoxin component YafN of YafNO toxin-antitoxin module
MTITTLSSRQFNQDTSGAKNATAAGPVIITDRGKPAHVLLTFNDYRTLTQHRQPTKITDLLAIDGADDIEFFPPVQRDVARPAEFS